MTITPTMADKKIGYISCDPGTKGSFCLLIPETKYIDFYPTNDKPHTTLEWLNLQNEIYNIQVICLENVHAIHGTSANSNFNFGVNVGIVTALSSATGCSVDKVTPKTWQKYLGVTKKGKAIKKNVAELIQQLYPLAEIHGPRGGLLDGRSDSLAIAHYASHKWRP